MGLLTVNELKFPERREKAYRLNDGDSLCALIRPTGAPSWLFRYRMDGRQNDFVIGVFPRVGLRDARVAAAEARALVEQGIHPAKHRKQTAQAQGAERADTFKANAENWIRKNTGQWTPRYLNQVTKTLATYVYPKIGAHPIKAVKPVEMRDIIDGIRYRTERPAPTVAKLVKMWCSAIFRHAIMDLRCENDPTSPLGRSTKGVRVKHKTPIGIKELGQLAYAVEARAKGDTPVTLALKLLAHTFVRPSELRCALWDEFDFDAKQWRIPALRMKMGEEHLVPLSEPTIQLLQKLSAMRPPNELRLFPNVRTPDKYMSETTLNRALERAGWKGRFSAHAFRATASTYLNENDYHPDVIERQLAHKQRNGVRASYNQAAHMDKRRLMMSEWSMEVETALNAAREQAKQQADATSPNTESAVQVPRKARTKTLLRSQPH